MDKLLLGKAKHIEICLQKIEQALGVLSDIYKMKIYNIIEEKDIKEVNKKVNKEE